jgi:hypothetical protein
MTNLVISCFRPPESHPLRDQGQLVYAINQLEFPPIQDEPEKGDGIPPVFKLWGTTPLNANGRNPAVSVFDILIGGIMYGSILVLGGCVVVIALLAIYVPTLYIRKTNKMIHLLEQIASNTRK